MGDQVARRAAACFQGREAELRRFADLVSEPGLLPHVIRITGPPGIGKSALMEAVRWQLQGAGLADVLQVGAQDFDHSPEGLERFIIARAAPWPRRPGDTPLIIVLDGYDGVSLSDRRHLRKGFTAALRGPVLVAICQRRPSVDLLVAQVGWRSVMEEMSLGPLQGAQTDALLDARGVSRGAPRTLALEAMGNPLLTVVAGAVTLREADSQRWPDRLAEEATRLLATCLAQEGLDAHGFALVEAAALATRVNEEMLGAMVRRDIVDDFARFTALSVVIEQAWGDYAVAEPFRSLVARDVQRRRPRWCDAVRVQMQARSAAAGPGVLLDRPRTHPSGALLGEVKSALEWHREGGGGEPCSLAVRLHMAGEDGPEPLRSLLTGILGALVESRSPRVSEAGRLLMYYYFDGAESHEAVAERINVSRATAFRRLSLGIELVAERLPSG